MFQKTIQNTIQKTINLISVISFFIATLAMQSSAWGFPLPKGDLNFNTQAQNFSATFQAGFNFEGIVALNNCSGSIVRFKNSRNSDFAMVLTNGHCYEGGFINPGKFVYGVQANRTFNLLDKNASIAMRLTASKVIYATMTGTDMTLYQLNQTYSEIRAKVGYDALTFSDVHPEAGQSIEVISGYWRKGYACQIDQFVYQLQEQDWSFSDSIRYSQPGCETIGGTSGSPIVLAGTRMVIGVNNTGNESGELCTMDNPCEVTPDGKKTAQQGRSYGQQSFWLYSCLNSANEVDLAVPGCMLTH